MKSKRQNSFHRQAGFSLVEILVGLVIGLLATLVIMQVFSVFEGQKRTTTGSADAQTNGSIALYTIGREIKMAGFGLIPATNSPLGCTILDPGATGITDISPVIITDGGAGVGASDTITVRYGDTASGGVPSQITKVGLADGLASDNDVGISNNMGCHVGDVALIVKGATCSLTNVNGPTDIAIPPVASTPANSISVTLDSVPGGAKDYSLSCLGNWVRTVFRVNPNYDPTGATGAANSQAYLERSGDPSVADIVNIQAQYGISASANTNQITNWVDAKDGLASGDWGPGLTVPNRNRIKAIHVAVVARNGLLEKDNVTGTCTTVKGTANNGPCAWDDSNYDAAPAINLSNDPNWQRYRYRVFETIIPLRNMIWAKGTL
jgi:type IV pilus assembly protein PilW